MTRLSFPGGFYCDGLPSGEHAVLFPGSHLQTHRGRIDLPGEDVLYLRITNIGGFKIAGQGHQSGLAWLWDSADGQWRSFGLTHGQSPVIFDAQGNLQVFRYSGPNTSSQGYRYVAEDGRIVTGDETYADPSRQIWEYTTLAGVTIGQGGQGGCEVLLPERRRLEPGDTRFIRVSEKDGLFSIAIVKPGEAVLLWATRAELAQLPLVDSPAPPIDVPPVPQEPPSMADVLETLKAERAKYPTDRPLTPAELGALLNAVAWAHKDEGVGLEKKTGGFNVPQPKTGIPVASDILRFPGNVGRDVLGDADGAAVPVWGDPGPADPATFVAPVDPAVTPQPAPDPAPTPDPEPAPFATSELQQIQCGLLMQIVAELQKQTTSLAAGLADVKAEISKGIKVRF